MKILKLMTRNPKTISPGNTLADAAKLMRRIDAGVLPVVENGKVTGMITDRDITVRSVAEGQDPNNVLVRDAMTRKAIFCYDDENIHEAGKAMLNEKIGRMPVLSRKNLSLAGIISLSDIIKQCGGKNMVEGRTGALTKAKMALPAVLALAAWGAYSNRRWISEQLHNHSAEKAA